MKRFEATLEQEWIYDKGDHYISLKWLVVDNKAKIKPIEFGDNKKDAIIVAKALNKLFKPKANK